MIVDCAVYEHGVRRDGEVALGEAFASGHDNDRFVWIGLHEPTEEEFDSVRREFELHDWRLRTPSTPISGQSSRSTARRSSWC